MRCKSPVSLKNGLVVPCGKCLLCLSAKRDDWSVRLQLHSAAYTSKPFFVTLTYDNEHLLYADKPTLAKSELQLFIKRLKERYRLYDSDFAYFGCGEYGDLLQRPHMHLILFGFDELQKVYENSWLDAHKMLRDVWQRGNVDVGVAEYSGIHYVTKYVLKYDDPDSYDGVQKPFIVYSNGLGLPWLDTPEAQFLKHRLNLFSLRNVKVPTVSFTGDVRDDLRNFVDAYKRLLAQFPTMTVTLPSGRRAPLPRYLKKRLLGTFEDFKDNPLWIQHHISNLIRSTEYILDHGEYDAEHLRSYQDTLNDFAERKIKQRIIQKYL